jgi:hypothetical protein
MVDGVNLTASASFLAGHGRVLDRRRFGLLMGETDVTAVLAAVDGYRNPDGGYGWGLEPDLRAPESQPGGALHALEVFAEVGVPTPRAVELCDWLASVSLPDGGLPFALPVADPAGCAPFWLQAAPEASLQSTAFVTSVALRVAAFDPAVAAHPWLSAAVEYCRRAILALDSAPHAIALSFAVQVADALGDATLLRRLGSFLPADGVLHVEGGAADEVLRPLDFVPWPGPARSLFSPAVIDDELARLSGQQLADGGWPVGFASYSPAASLEWRGYATVRAVSVIATGSA